jgi:ubiquinone/menaquinone biosynthesis C-methylase UbiE
MPLFDAWPERYAAWFRTPLGRRVFEVELALLGQMLHIAPGMQLLDAGCGSGLFTASLLERGAQVTGLDVSRPMLAAARQALLGRAFQPLVGDLRALPFADARFDTAVSITALEFIADGRRAVSELFRVTRPGGQVVVATLNRHGPWARRRSAEAERNPDSVFRDAHFRTPAELAALAPVAGELRSAVHFDHQTPADEALSAERDGLARDPEGGAFVVAAWRKP